MAKGDKQGSGNLVDSLFKLTGQVAGGTVELARSTATMTAMFGESRLRSALLSKLEPERLEAMAEAGHFLRDARETAGMSLKDLADSLGMSDKTVLEEVESGETILPLELVLRAASLLARHDPIPFLIKFMRTYNPALEKTLESWGILALPKQYERERRFLNIYRQHDRLRGLSDEEFARFIDYTETSTSFVIDVMLKEKAANVGLPKPAPAKTAVADEPAAVAKASARPQAKRKAPAKSKSKAKAATRRKTTARKKSSTTRSRKS
jgi:transcriptional regulator with XRE-family HTH domain